MSDGTTTKKIVRSSNLALRFYKHDGWTRECLEQYLVAGKIMDTALMFQDRPEEAYFLLDVGSRFDMQRLYENEVSDVVRRFDDDPSETDFHFMERFNW